MTLRSRELPLKRPTSSNPVVTTLSIDHVDANLTNFLIHETNICKFSAKLLQKN